MLRYVVNNCFILWMLWMSLTLSGIWLVRRDCPDKQSGKRMYRNSKVV